LIASTIGIPTFFGVASCRLVLRLDVVADFAQGHRHEAIIEFEFDGDFASVFGEIHAFRTGRQINPLAAISIAASAVLTVVAGWPPGQTRAERVARVVSDGIGFEREAGGAGAGQAPFQAVRDLRLDTASQGHLVLVAPRAVVQVSGGHDPIPAIGQNVEFDREEITSCNGRRVGRRSGLLLLGVVGRVGGRSGGRLDSG